jgi:anti-sigma regulatory factor (Ser/Thr protein kinase)
MPLVLAPEPTSIGAGRRWLVERATRAGASDASVAVVRLLGSEVVSNALLHGPAGRAVVLRAAQVGSRIRIEVDDAGTQPPEVLRPDAARAGGRGMQLVDRLSARWGVELRREGGKTVWFEVEL